MPRAWLRRLRALAAALLLLTLLAGVPAVLAGTVGNPAGALHDLLAGDLSDTALIALLAAIAWAGWTQFAVATAVELASAVRATPMPRRIPGVLAGQQQLARSLVTAVFLLGPVTTAALTSHPLATLPGPPAPVSISTTLTAVHSPVPAPPAVVARATGATAAPAARRAPPTAVYTVPAGPAAGPATLWDIAQAQLGAGERWREIWQLNQGRPQPGGARMTAPGRLLPGWTVLVPAATSTTDTAGGGRSALRAVPDPTAAAGPAGPEVTVQAGDTLSGLAAKRGQWDWRTAWQGNAGRPEPDGARYADPDLIRPGWRLTIPVAGPAAPAPDADASAAAPVTPAAPAPPPTTAAPPPSAVPTPPGPAVPAAPGSAGRAAVPAPTALAANPAAANPAPAGHGDGSVLSRRPVQVVAFAGGGVLLAASTLRALRRRRRRQFRDRALGRTISSTPVGLAPLEKALLARGEAGGPDVDWLHTALGSLAQTLAARPDGALPDVVAVRLTGQQLQLVLTTGRQDPPAPWQADETGLRWSIGRVDPLPWDPGAAGRHSAPYPALATVGYTMDGEHWLVDLERVGALSLTGDPQRCLDLARFLAAELAHNTWSDQLQVTLVGFGAELAGLNPSRVTHRTSLAEAARDAHATLRETAQVLQASGTSVLEGRLRGGLVGDGWSPHVLLVAPDTEPDAEAGSGETLPDTDLPALLGLLGAMRAQRSRTAVALVLAGDTEHQGAIRWQLHVDSGGLLSIPALDLQLVAQQLPAGEAADLAALLQLAADSPDIAVPAAAGAQRWEQFSDAAGAPLPQFTGTGDDGDGAAGQPDQVGRDSGDVSSVLPLPPAAYLPVTATTTEDVAVLAPPVSAQVRHQVEDADPTLDADVRSWHDPHSGIAKLTLLGPVAVSDAAGAGTADKRRDRVTEVVAFLACRPHGVTTEQWIAQMWPTEPDVPDTRPRAYANTARAWLGKDPRTGQDYLPRANEGAGTVGVYRLRGVLIDAELFRRLRLRGVARGPAGIADLQAALDLVTGEPLSRLRAAGGQWLVDTPVHHHYTAMIVDTAHLVATQHLAAGQPDRAEAAAQVALLAGSTDDIALLDLVAAADAAGQHAQADTYIARILGNHDAEVEEDLPPRTYDVLRRRRWLPQHDAQAG